MTGQAYETSHQDRLNLLLHLVAVPLFWLASISSMTFLAMGSWAELGYSAAGFGVSLALQAIGHKREASPPNPFSGPFDFLSRIFREQFYRFPALVLSGAWWRNLKRS